MVDFRKYHQAHEMLINLQRGTLMPQTIVGVQVDDPRRSAVSYLATKILRAKEGADNVSVIVGKQGFPFISSDSAQRSKTFRQLKRGESVWQQHHGLKPVDFTTRYMLEIGGYGIVVYYEKVETNAHAA